MVLENLIIFQVVNNLPISYEIRQFTTVFTPLQYITSHHISLKIQKLMIRTSTCPARVFAVIYQLVRSHSASL